MSNVVTIDGEALTELPANEPDPDVIALLESSLEKARNYPVRRVIVLMEDEAGGASSAWNDMATRDGLYMLESAKTVFMLESVRALEMVLQESKDE